MFITISLLMAAACLLPAAGKLDADWDEIATRFSYPDYAALSDDPPQLATLRKNDPRFDAWRTNKFMRAVITPVTSHPG